MCGIAGIVELGGRAEPADVATMTRVIAHRGPDGSGLASFDTRAQRRIEGDGDVIFGHRRLSIIDIQGGAQPMASADGLVWVTYNGEIYNYRELRAELEATGAQFKTSSDTEVLVEGYRAWGMRFVERLNGIFAFALLDLAKPAVWLIRDRLGVKPLYYAVDGHRITFASELKAITAVGKRRTLDRAALDRLLTYRYVPSPGTLLGDVFKLPPASVVEITDAGHRTWCYWDPPAAAREVDIDDAVEQYRESLATAVRRQLISDVPVGLYLSSGMDSTALLALMRKAHGPGIPTFTVAFRGGGRGNEHVDAAAIARTFDATHSVLEISEQDYLDAFEEYVWHVEEPVSNESAPAAYFLSKLAHRDVKVVLSGQGADELWAGYRRYVGEWLSSLYRRVPRTIRDGAMRTLTRLWPQSERVRRAAFSLGETDTLRRFLRIYTIFTPEMKRRLYGPLMRSIAESSALEPLQRFSSRASDPDTLNTLLHVDLRMSLPDDLLLVCDKLSMSSSVEARVPYLDHELVELVESWPSDLKLRRGRTKWIHRKAINSLVPPGVATGRKKGFSNPLSTWLRKGMASWVHELLLAPGARCHELFEPAALERLVAENERGSAWMRQLYLLVSLEVWLRRFQPAIA